MLIQKINFIGRTYRNIQRYTEILGILFRFGFGDLVTSLKVEQYVNLGKRVFSKGKKGQIEKLTRAVRIRMALEELGPTFIKFGQVLSTRPDLLPPNFIKELVKLQEQVPPFPFKEVTVILNEELGGEDRNIFSHIDPAPLAAASIGQVHRARLTSGEDVVIKVQRPGIQKTIEVDLEILMHLATLMERHVEGVELHKPTEVVEWFGRRLEAELDYGIEALNMERLGGMYQDDPHACVPKVYRRATTSKVLTMDYIEGIPVGDLKRLREMGYDLNLIADRGADHVLRQTLVSGFFHGDPHPGNLLVLPGHVICFLDLGLIGRLDRKTREDIVSLVMGVVRKDAPTMTSAILRITEWEDEPNRRALGRDLSAFVDQYYNRPLKELELGKILQRIFDLAMEYRLRVPPDLLLLIKSLTTIEGVGRQLNPNFDILTKAEPFVRKVWIDRYRPKRIVEELWEYSGEIKDLLHEVPSDIRTLLRLARRGRFKTEMDVTGLESLRLTHERTTNRLSFAIVLASLIIGSSVVINAGIPPTWHGIPLIGLAGYLVAGVMGFWLLITILRRGMM